jgi:hypothetical protein
MEDAKRQQLVISNWHLALCGRCRQHAYGKTVLTFLDTGTEVEERAVEQKEPRSF